MYKMNPIILSIAILYFVILITKGLFSSKELQSMLPLYLANIIIFMQTNATDIILTVAVMLSIIVYFTIIGVDLNTKGKLRLKKEVVYEGFVTSKGVVQDAAKIANKDLFPDSPPVPEYKTTEDEVDTFLSRKGGIEKQNEHCKLLSSLDDCMKTSFCTWCGDQEKGECHKGGIGGPTYYPTLKKENENFKCDEYYFRGKSKKPKLYKRDNSYKIE
tara:strand:- start:6786 stop:7433 length:648 start_codon:yes stop_codon:yes gene_type:complete